MSGGQSRRRMLASTGLVLAGGAVVPARGRAKGPRSAADRQPALRWEELHERPRNCVLRSVAPVGDGRLAALGDAGRADEKAGWVGTVDPATGAVGSSGTVEPADGFAGRFLDLAAGDAGLAAVAFDRAARRTTVVGTTPTGGTTWETVIEPESDAEGAAFVGKRVVAAGDGFLVSGHESGTENGPVGTVVRLGPEGAVERRHAFFSGDAEHVGPVLRDGDRYVAAAMTGGETVRTAYDGNPMTATTIFAFDDAGAVQWQSTVAHAVDGAAVENSTPTDLTATADGFVLAGRTVDESGRNGRPWIVATGPTGEVRSESVLDPREAVAADSPHESESSLELHGVAAADGAVYAVGVAEGPSMGRQSWVGGFAPDGSLRWQEPALRDGDGGLLAVASARDGGVVLTGGAQRDREDGGAVLNPWFAKLGGDAATTQTTATATGSAEPSTDPTSPPADGSATGSNSEPTAADGPGFGVATAFAALGGGVVARYRGARDSGD